MVGVAALSLVCMIDFSMSAECKSFHVTICPLRYYVQQPPPLSLQIPCTKLQVKNGHVSLNERKDLSSKERTHKDLSSKERTH